MIDKHPHAEAREIDATTCARILQKSTSLAGDMACGAHALNGLMCATRAHDLSVDQLDVRTSGDTAGDRSRVIGYGAFALC